MTEIPARSATIRWGADHFLFRPLGWVADRLGPVTETEPRLFARLIKIDRAKMHLVALALAHMRNDTNREGCAFLLDTPSKHLLHTLFGDQPTGIYHALNRLPDTVLAPSSYRYLINLLQDPVVAKFLNHCVSIDEPLLATLNRLPKVLRTPGIMKLFRHIDGLTDLMDGLQILADRLNSSIEDMATEIAALDQPAQIAAKIRSIVDALPLPQALPPSRTESFRRVDCIAEVRRLARDWHNCLADCVYGINEGTYAVYLSNQWQAVALASRYGRLGWYLVQIKGPRNTDIERNQLTQIQMIFSAAGIHPATKCEPIRAILLHRAWAAAPGRH